MTNESVVNGDGEEKQPDKPADSEVSKSLRGVAVAVLGLGLGCGLIVLFNGLPEASEKTTPINWLVLGLGLAQIVGGVAAATVLYALADISDSVRGIWAQGK